MTAAALLLAYAAALAVLGPRLLERAEWTTAVPRLAIGAWLALAASLLLAVVLAGAVIVLPLEIHHGDGAGFARHCLRELQEHYGDAGGAALAAAAAILMCAVPARLAASLLAVGRETARERAALRRVLAACPAAPELGAVVVDDPRPAAYCLPGADGGLIVLTSGAVALLDRAQLRAVVAHERAHLAGRHHRLAAAAEAAARGFGFAPLLARLPERLGHLVELAADDAAARTVGRRTLARSLLSVAAAQTPGAALAAGGGDTVARVQRLLREPPALGPTGIGTILSGSAAALAAPVLVVAVPVATAVGIACCQA
ncbi:M56 family metallopeptidase [Glycomyces endophyticus]|uniref:M56 family metallopeptidase n=1 Tax=Glycomyces endophyticus TaxID=480996 RepID=A0ABN2FU85_9ACTN